MLSECIEKPVAFDVATYPNIMLNIILDGQSLDLNVLPDGLKSILVWLGDLMMRLDRLNPDPLADSLAQPFILLLDEIDIHLHPLGNADYCRWFSDSSPMPRSFAARTHPLW